MDHPRPGLRYVDAGDLDDPTIDFDGMDVESHANEKLGDIDGFIVDVRAARPYYVVVDAGGWFTSKFFLLPVGHAALDSRRHRLIADVSRERVERFPGFDLEEFSRLSEAELNLMDRVHRLDRRHAHRIERERVGCSLRSNPGTRHGSVRR